MSKTDKIPVPPIDKFHKAARIGSLVMGALLTALEIFKLVKEDDAPRAA